jgi:hypothetical protein
LHGPAVQIDRWRGNPASLDPGKNWGG